jgi:hypothetical protein
VNVWSGADPDVLAPIFTLQAGRVRSEAMTDEAKRRFLVGAIEQRSGTMIEAFRQVMSAGSFSLLRSAVHALSPEAQERLRSPEDWTFLDPVLDKLSKNALKQLINQNTNLAFARVLLARGATPSYIFPILENDVKHRAAAFLELFLGHVSRSPKGLSVVPTNSPYYEMPTETCELAMRYFNSDEYAGSMVADEMPHRNEVSFVRYLASRYRLDSAFEWLHRYIPECFRSQAMTDRFFLRGAEPIHMDHLEKVLPVREARTLAVRGATLEKVKKLNHAVIAGMVTGAERRDRRTCYVPTTERPRNGPNPMVAEFFVRPLLHPKTNDALRQRVGVSMLAMTGDYRVRDVLRIVPSKTVTLLYSLLSVVEPYCAAARAAAAVLRQRKCRIKPLSLQEWRRYEQNQLPMDYRLSQRVEQGGLGLEEPSVIFQRDGIFLGEPDAYVDIRPELKAASAALEAARVCDDVADTVLSFLAVGFDDERRARRAQKRQSNGSSSSSSSSSRGSKREREEEEGEEGQSSSKRERTA